MCAALVRACYQVTATDERAEAEEAAVACGATWQDTPAQAAAAAGVLITMLPGPREVQAAMLGEAGALKGLAAGAAWIDMTSNSPAAVRPIREHRLGLNPAPGCSRQKAMASDGLLEHRARDQAPA